MKSTQGKRNLVRATKLAAVSLAFAATVYANATGPLPAHTGAPNESTCVKCHQGTLNSGPGSVTIENVPDAYAPNQEITLRVRVRHPDRSRWGFQLTALDANDQPVGTFTLVNRGQTRITNGVGEFAGRVYVEHQTDGTFPGQRNEASWEVKWTAPEIDAGRVTFYAAGNAANNNGQNSGDSIYTTSVGTGASLPVVVSPTFKKGKIVLAKNGSNVEPGAVLLVSGGPNEQTETFDLTAKGAKWIVKKQARSEPGGKSPEQAWPAGSTVTFVVRNPNGSESAPVDASR